MKRRLFIAVTLPDTMLDAIEEAMGLLRARLPVGARTIPRENWHVTLVFLGEQNEEMIPKIREAMEAALQDFARGALTTGDMVFAPSLHEPRMIWLTLSDTATRYFASLRERLAKELRARNVAWEDAIHTFRGHITLAKFDAQPAEKLGALKVACTNRSEVYAIELMASTRASEGSHYTSIVRMAQE